MTAPAAMYGYILCLASLLWIAACDPSAGRASPVRVVDLIDEFERAEQRPPARLALAAHTIAGVTHPAIIMPVPSRLTWRLPLPRGGLLRTFVAPIDAAAPLGTTVPLRFRIGIADDRIYEGLTHIVVTPEQRGWIELRADLSAYAGWKWSLFYRPDRIVWSVVLAADALAGGQAKVVWGAPEIVADSGAVREYLERRRDVAAR